MLKDLLIYIAQNLVDNKEAVKVTEVEENGVINLTLEVDSADMGKVIGRQGRIAKAIRTVIKSVAIRENIKVNVEISG